MEGDKTADNEKELTSTSSSAMDKQLLSTNKEEKSDSNDTLPTSSTDASTSIKSTHLVSDDPISSTSSEMDPSKSKPGDQLPPDVDKSANCFDTDAELFGMSITAGRSEDIEENVDDLVNDLETLLGESTDDFNVTSKSPKIYETKTDVTSAIQEDHKSEGEMSRKADTTVPSERTGEEKKSEEAKGGEEELMDIVADETQSVVNKSQFLEAAVIGSDDIIDKVSKEVSHISPEISESKSNKSGESGSQGSTTVEIAKKSVTAEITSEVTDETICDVEMEQAQQPTMLPAENASEEEIVQVQLQSTIKESSDVSSSHSDVTDQVVLESTDQLTSTPSDPVLLENATQDISIPENAVQAIPVANDARLLENTSQDLSKASDTEVIESATNEISIVGEKMTTEISSSLTSTEGIVAEPVKDVVKDPGEEISIDNIREELTLDNAEFSKEVIAEEQHPIVEESSDVKEVVEEVTGVEEPQVHPEEPSPVEDAQEEVTPKIDVPSDHSREAEFKIETLHSPVYMEVDGGEELKTSEEHCSEESADVRQEEIANKSIIATSDVASIVGPNEITEVEIDTLPVVDAKIDKLPEVVHDEDHKATNIDVVQQPPIACDSEGVDVLQSTKDMPSIVNEMTPDVAANTEPHEEEHIIKQGEPPESGSISQDTEEIRDATIPTENVSSHASGNSINEIIEINEVPDSASDDIGNAEIMDIPKVVEEPEEEISINEEPVEQNVGIEEVTDEQIVKEHLEELKVEPVVISSDQTPVVDIKITEPVVPEGDDVGKNDKSSGKMTDVIEIPCVNKDTAETSQNYSISIDAPEEINVVEPVEQAVAVTNVENVVNEPQETDAISTVEVDQSENGDLKPEEEVTCEQIESPSAVNEQLADATTVVSAEEFAVAESSISNKIDYSKKASGKDLDVILSKNAQNVIETPNATPEIIVRRKTVEQDLEKVVCLSEESSDSDYSGPSSNIDKPIQNSQISDEDANLIKIASEVEQFPDPDLPIEENIPVDEISPVEAQPAIESMNSTSNLETLLAVASLQNESVSDTREHRRLSENEIREMEAIRMAVASITDSSQDTYDSFMVENSVTLDNSTQNGQENQDISVNMHEQVVAKDAGSTNMEDIEQVDRYDKVEISVASETDGASTELTDNLCQLQQSSVKDVEHREETDQTTTTTTANVVNPNDQANSTVEDTMLNNITEDSSEIIEPCKEDNRQLTNERNDEVRTVEATKDLVDAESTIINEAEVPWNASTTSKAPSPKLEILKKDSEIHTSELDQVTEPLAAASTGAGEENAKVVDDSSIDTTGLSDKGKTNTEEEVVKKKVAGIPSKIQCANNILETEVQPNHSAVKQSSEEKPQRNRSKRSSKINEPLTINVEEVEKKEKVYSPKITIKPLKVPDEEVSTTSETDANKGSLKMTITKQSDKMHSILKIYNPEDEVEVAPQAQEEPIPKLIIKPKLQHVEQQHSPKMTTRSAKVCSPTSTRCSSPRITIKSVTKPADVKVDALSPLKITIKPVVKPDEGTRKQSPKGLKEPDQKNHNPKITIKPIPKPSEEKEDLLPSTPKLIIKPIPKPTDLATKEEVSVSTPKVTIRPLKRPLEETDLDSEHERSSPKITIKPLVKPSEQDSIHASNQSTPKIKIKPVRKHEEGDLSNEVDREEGGSPKISIKPVMKPPDLEPNEDEEVKQRIVLKINKGNLPPNKESKKRDHSEEDKGEKMGIKLKFSTTGGHTHIVQEKEDGSKRQRKDSGYLSSAAKREIEDIPHKRPLEDKLPEKSKRLRSALTPDKSAESTSTEKVVDPKVLSPIALTDDSRPQHSKLEHSATADILKIAVLASQTTHIEATPVLTVGIATPTVSTGPKKRGRPRKVPLKFREDVADTSTSSPTLSGQTTSTESLSTSGNESLIVEATSSGGRPKRSCRGQNVMATLGIKPRKPRGRGRGSKVNMGDRVPPSPVGTPIEVPVKPEKAEKGAKAKLKLLRKSSEKEVLNQETESNQKETVKSALEAVGPVSTSEASSGISANLVPTILETSLKRKLEDSEDHTAHKKKKEDKTPIKKLEVTTRRQKGQLQKKGGDIVKPISELPQESKAKKPIEEAIPSSSHSTPLPDSIIGETSPSLSTPLAAAPREPTAAHEKFAELNSKNYPDITITKTKIPTKNIQNLPEKPADEKIIIVEKVEERLSIDSNPKADIKKESALDEEEDDDLGQEVELDTGDDSESERQREYVLQKKQEAIKKCRAKRMEKLARAAELKRKRQEQAAQQREARKAAEEAERAATEKARATKRYGRYGVPKPQISLIDAPVQETAGTVKGHMGVSDAQAKPLSIAQPVPTEDNADKEPLKNIEGHFTPSKSPQKLLFSQPMVVDAPEESPIKIRRSLAREDVVMVDEETRMSADFRGSRAQTPAKQGVQPPDVMVEDSQGSIGTEGGKSRSSKAPKMEVFQDLESTTYSADQLAEYSWNGQGPFMIQEQVTQYLGIKSFKRKYPNITRRPVDIQERDYLKESGQVTEAQCDLGLTAVASQDILDIMYTDFQDKYEDYCKAQREKQARELANKQKALNQFTLKPGFDKLDILEQAVQSAAAWNSQFNKARREQRRAHMDLQNWSVQYPKSKMKIIPTPKVGHYPIALVPGQFTDYYKDYTPTELNNLPLNTMCYHEIKIPHRRTESEESSNGSDSDSESTSGSSSSGSSCDDTNCKECDKKTKKVNPEVRETDSDDVVFVENDASSSDSVVLVSVTTAPVTA